MTKHWLPTFGTLLAATFLSALPVAAHHSTAPFDTNTVVKIEGTIKLFRWTNPHAAFKVEGTASTASGDAPDGVWTIEMTAPNILINQGWKRTSLKEGDKVTVYANPLRDAQTLDDGSEGGLYVGVVLADGTKLGRVDGGGAGSNQ
jgi:hypothetical protein